MTRRRVLLGSAGALLILASCYLVFELGRHQAGYSLLDHRREAAQQREQIGAQAQTIDELRRELAIVETSRNIDRETYSRLERTLMELEARLQSQEEELAFYRGIIQPADGESGLRVQSVEAVPGNGEQRYVLRIVLMQTIAHNRRVEGVVKLQIAGVRFGEPETLDLGELTAADEITELEYDFRYFQGLEQELALPDGFDPAAVEIEVRPRSPRGEPLAQTFDWAAVTGSRPEE